MGFRQDKMLREAACLGNFDGIAKEISRGADVNAIFNDGSTSLMAAAAGGHVNCVELLLKHGANMLATDKYEYTAFMLAARSGHVNCVELLLKHGANMLATHKSGETAFMLAARRGHVNCAEFLLKHGADVNAKDDSGWTVFNMVAGDGHLVNVEFLLKHGADVNASYKGGWTSLMSAGLQGRANVVEYLLKHGANVNAAHEDGSTSLTLAACYGHTGCLRVLLNHDADANAKQENGYTALIEAALRGHFDCVHLLLKYGADVNASGVDGGTALMAAVGNWPYDCVELLLRHSADVNAIYNDGSTALMAAAAGGHLDCVDMLVRNGADVNAVMNDGYTAMMHAAKEGHLDCIELLLKHGTKLDVDKTKEAVNIAVGEGHMESAEILRRHLDSLDFEKIRHQVETLAMDSSQSTIAPPSAPYMTAPLAPLHRPATDISHQNWVIPFEELQLGTLLGKGSFGKVFSATWHGTEVAAKLFDFPGGDTNAEDELSTALMKKIQDEADLLASIRHPHVVSFLAMCSSPPCMITELCSQGSLHDVMIRSKTDPSVALKLTWAQRLSMLIDAAAGMTHLHHRKPPVLHRDLKSLNLLVDSGWKVKIADLGLSKLVKEATAGSHAGSTMRNMNFRWLGPEVLETGKWESPSDVYAFGVVMWELLTWELPWSHIINDIMIPMAIVRGDALPVPELNALPGPKPLFQGTHDRYIELMKSCMDKNPPNRPSFPNIVSRLREIAANEIDDPHDDTISISIGHAASVSSRNSRTELMECGICLSPMGANDDKPMATPPCGHVYCYDCLNTIAREDASEGAKCPTCRQPYNASQIMKLFVN